MNKITTLLFLLFVVNVSGEPQWNVRTTGENMIFGVTTNSVNNTTGFTIENGDIIGVFFDNGGVLECGGKIRWKGANNSLAAFGDDNFTQDKDGFTSGENVTWMIWDSSRNEICSVVKANYFFGNGNYSPSGLEAIVNFEVTNSKLAVDLIYLEAVLEDKQVYLNWATETETNHDFFQIERSADGYNYHPLGRKILGDGNSITKKEYSFIDESPMMKANYYRLKIQDTFGEVEYTKVIQVYLDFEESWDVYPNPMINEKSLTIKFSQTFDKKITLLHIVNSLGTKVFQTIVEPEEIQHQQLKIPIPHLPIGMYYIGTNAAQGHTKPMLIINE